MPYKRFYPFYIPLNIFVILFIVGGLAYYFINKYENSEEGRKELKRQEEEYKNSEEYKQTLRYEVEIEKYKIETPLHKRFLLGVKDFFKGLTYAIILIIIVALIAGIVANILNK